MKISVWRQNSLRVTKSSDTFYKRPLPDMTLFWLDLSRAEVEPHAGAFSVKTVFAGREHYDFGRRGVWVLPGQMLLINADETYASHIDRPTKSLSVFYRNADVVSAARTFTSGTDDLLHNPHDGDASPEVAQIVLQTDRRMWSILNELATAAIELDHEGADQAARNLLTAALSQSLKLVPSAALAHIVKRSTRNELLDRVLRARAAIHDRQGRGCTLDGLAELACLSKYHFLRVFSEAFGETPLALARRLRLEAAKRDLERGEHVSRVARRAGFRNLPAFNRAFRRTFGRVGAGRILCQNRNFEHEN